MDLASSGVIDSNLESLRIPDNSRGTEDPNPDPVNLRIRHAIFFRDGPVVDVRHALYVDDTLLVMSNTTIRDWFAAEFEKKFDQSPGSGGGIV